MIRRLIDMQAVSEVGGPSMQAYGTSEGVKKAWDARGRGQAVVNKADEYGFGPRIFKEGGDVRFPSPDRKILEHSDRDMSGHSITVHNDGRWTHSVDGKSQGHGNGAKSFETYIESHS